MTNFKKEYYIYIFLAIVAIIFGYYEYKNYEANQSTSETTSNSNSDNYLNAINTAGYGTLASGNISITIPSEHIGINSALNTFLNDTLSSTANSTAYANEYANQSSFTSSNPLLSQTANTLQTLTLPSNYNNVTSGLTTVTNPDSGVQNLNQTYSITTPTLKSGYSLVNNPALNVTIIPPSLANNISKYQYENINNIGYYSVYKQAEAKPSEACFEDNSIAGMVEGCY